MVILKSGFGAIFADIKLYNRCKRDRIHICKGEKNNKRLIKIIINRNGKCLGVFPYFKRYLYSVGDGGNTEMQLAINNHPLSLFASFVLFHV